MNIHKRQLLQLSALTPLSCTVSSLFAQVPQSKPPIADTRPFRKVNVGEDGRRVLFFFDFSCPFCAKYHAPIVKWSASVPASVQTMFVPVVTMTDMARKQEQIIAAKCYYAAFSIASKSQMHQFCTSVYDSRAASLPLVSKEIWTKALKFAGLDVKKFGAALNSGNSDVQVQFAARKTVQYALVATPSVGVGGKYVITPDDVLGDEEMFFNILNGLTSEIL